MSSKKGIVFTVKIPKYNKNEKKELHFDSIRPKAGVHFKSTKQTRHNQKIHLHQMDLDS